MHHRLVAFAFLIGGCTGSATVTGTTTETTTPHPVAVHPVAGHPAYMHALSDLRAARRHPPPPANAQVKWDEKMAIREIDAAMSEIRRAAIDDGKPVDDH